ncbi:hypothetical protein U1839_01230 [Sphingomonas sp. RT2P30]|uniref:hypothetical protein n=1 Tax=Parasphingomonas halimpatiens TaxID=3096162 RepID=UPI002FC5F311
MSEVDRAVARAGELLHRVADERRVGARQRARVGEAGARLTRVVLADGVIIAAAVVIGLFVPLGILGFTAVIVMLLLATLFFAAMPVGPEPTPERLRETPLKALPAQTARWLDTQRSALPAPARTLLDGIGVKLDTLAPQLATLGEDDPAAVEVRKLVGEQLPEFLKGYARVPEPLRKVERNGKSPDTELADGLRVIDEEIAEMTVKLAQGDLDGLATRGRFLEIKYRDDGVAS